MKRVPITPRGEHMLREELKQRKTVDRPKITAMIAEARAHGDLKENAEYHAAREQQGFNEGRIREIEAKLAEAEVIDIKKLENSGRVVFGSTVTVINTESDNSAVYQIVGEDEADIKENKISVAAPLARALIGKEVGDVAMVKTPSGEVEYEVDQIEYI